MVKLLQRLGLLVPVFLLLAFAAGADGPAESDDIGVYEDVDAVEQRYINQLVVGGANNIKRASKAISRAGQVHRDVYDVLAEVILQNQAKVTKADADAYAWACKALGSSGNGRYRSTLETVIGTDANGKVTKHAKKALAQLDGEPDQYVAGETDLDLMQDTVAEPVGQTAPAQPAAVIYAPALGGLVVVPQVSAGPARTYEPISTAKKGMTMQEVYSLCGPPSDTSSHMTGKQFIPYYGRWGGDTHRQIAHYANQGQVVFTRKSKYDPNWRVVEIHMDSGESIE
jgi:hypothetical protein